MAIPRWTGAADALFAPTDNALPTPRGVPTATPVLTALPLPTTDEIAALEQKFYDNQSPFARTSVLVDATAIEFQSQADT